MGSCWPWAVCWAWAYVAGAATWAALSAWACCSPWVVGLPKVATMVAAVVATTVVLSGGGAAPFVIMLSHVDRHGRATSRSPSLNPNPWTYEVSFVMVFEFLVIILFFYVNSKNFINNSRNKNIRKIYEWTRNEKLWMWESSSSLWIKTLNEKTNLWRQISAFFSFNKNAPTK